MLERRKFGPLLVLAALIATTATAQEMSEVEIKTTHVAGSIYMLEGRGGNLGASVGEDGILLIDDQFAPLADKIRAALEKLGKGKLEFVLNTHWHGDHTGGNAAFGAEAPVMAHTNVRKRLSTRQEIFGNAVEPSPPEALPVITFDSGLSVHFNGEEIEAIHFPRAHTDGDTVIFFQGSNVVHMGDLMFSGTFPFVDLGSGGDVEGLLKNLVKILDRLPDDVKLIPGHGPLSTRADLESYHQALAETTEIVRRGISAGKSLEQLKEEGLPEEYAAWGGGFITTERWIETVHSSLTGGKD